MHARLTSGPALCSLYGTELSQVPQYQGHPRQLLQRTTHECTQFRRWAARDFSAWAIVASGLLRSQEARVGRQAGGGCAAAGHHMPSVAHFLSPRAIRVIAAFAGLRMVHPLNVGI